MSKSLLLVAVSSLFGSCVAPGSQRTPVTPQRPTVSFNTQTTAEGTLELEAGVQADPGDSFFSPMRLKYGLGQDEEISIAVSPFNFIERPGDDGTGFGDLSVAFRKKVWTNEQTSAAFRFETLLPTGNENEGLSTGELSFFAGGIVDHQIDMATYLTGFYQVGVIGDPNDDDPDLAHSAAVAGYHQLDERNELFGELAGFVNPGPVDPVIFTGGVAHKLSDDLIIDAGVIVGMNDDAADLQFLVGLTTNFGPIVRN